MTKLAACAFLIASVLAQDTGQSTGTAAVDGKPLANAKIAVKSADGKTFEATTDQRGIFSATVPIEFGSYKTVVTVNGVAVDTLISILKPKELPAPQPAAPVKDPPAPKPSPGPNSSTFGGLAAGLLSVYWLIALFARYHNIVKVNQEWLRAAIDMADEDVKTAANDQIRSSATDLIRKAEGVLDADSSATIMAFLFGMRGQIPAAWVRLNEAKRILARGFTKEQALSRLRVIVQQLRPEYSTMADKIDAVLATVNQPDTVTLDFLRATLGDAMTLANEKEEATAAQTIRWQNKAFTLTFVGICLLIAMATLLPNPTLLFVGFAGGFASRLMRGKDSTATASAGLDWTTLFLSPIYGAFSGWAGILILGVLRNLKVLGDMFEPLHADWSNASIEPWGLAFAFVLGFSERFFSAVTDLAVNAAVKNQNATASDTPGVPKPASGADAGIPKERAVRQPGPQAPAAVLPAPASHEGGDGI